MQPTELSIIWQWELPSCLSNPLCAQHPRLVCPLPLVRPPSQVITSVSRHISLHVGNRNNQDQYVLKPEEFFWENILKPQGNADLPSAAAGAPTASQPQQTTASVSGGVSLTQGGPQGGQHPSAIYSSGMKRHFPFRDGDGDLPPNAAEPVPEPLKGFTSNQFGGQQAPQGPGAVFSEFSYKG